MTVSPTVVTTPPRMVGSTTTLTSTCLPVARLDGVGQSVALVLGELDGAADLGDRLVGLGRRHGDERVDDRRELAGPAGADRHAHEGDGGRARPCPRGGPRRSAGGGSAGRWGSVRALAQLVAALEGTGEAEQLVADPGRVALGPGDVEHRPGVGAWCGRQACRTSVPVPDAGDVLLDELGLGLAVEVRCRRRPRRRRWPGWRPRHAGRRWPGSWRPRRRRRPAPAWRRARSAGAAPAPAGRRRPAGGPPR